MLSRMAEYTRLRAGSGYCRGFSFDGLSWRGEALQLFYIQYVEERVKEVKSGGKCTIIMYGAIGSGKKWWRKRAVQSINCNERSSRNHCTIIVDVPSVGGRLVLVDMAGSENIEQAGIGA